MFWIYDLHYKLSGETDGYTLLITSWENDGDNYKNQILSGLTKEDVIVPYYCCNGHNLMITYVRI